MGKAKTVVVNKLCESCKEECKQSPQVKIVKCPLYKPIRKK